jgi:hypothetical protein
VQINPGTQGSAVSVHVSPASAHAAPTTSVVHVPGPQPPSGAWGGDPHPPQFWYQRSVSSAHAASPQAMSSAASVRRTRRLQGAWQNLLI